MIRSTLKKVTAFALAAMMSVSVLGMNPVSVDAASKKPTKITLNKKTASVKVKKTVTLKVKSVKPSKASKTVRWTTSNKKIATVTSKGVVKGVKEGKATITATSTKNKKVKAKCVVTVYKEVSKKVTAKKSGNLYTYTIPASNLISYTFKANGKSYNITDSTVKTFMTLFGTSNNNLVKKWAAKKPITLKLGQLSVKVTGTKTDRTLVVAGPAAYEGRYTARMYTSKTSVAKKRKANYVFTVKGAKTNNKWQYIDVKETKTSFTFTATNKAGVKYTAVVLKNGTQAQLKAGTKVLYKYKKTSKNSAISIDQSVQNSAKVTASYKYKKTK